MQVLTAKLSRTAFLDYSTHKLPASDLLYLMPDSVTGFAKDFSEAHIKTRYHLSIMLIKPNRNSSPSTFSSYSYSRLLFTFNLKRQSHRHASSLPRSLSAPCLAHSLPLRSLPDCLAHIVLLHSSSFFRSFLSPILYQRFSFTSLKNIYIQSHHSLDPAHRLPTPPPFSFTPSPSPTPILLHPFPLPHPLPYT